MLLRRSLLAAVVVLPLGFPLGASAQERDGDEKCECARFHRIVPETLRATQVFTRRAYLGVMLDTDQDASTDAIGARIEEVLDDSPADKAGLRDGDIITHINGRGVASSAGGDDKPASRVTSMLRELEPGDTVRVGYRRGSDARSAQVVTDSNARVFALRDFPEMRTIVPEFRHLMPGGRFEFGRPGMAVFNFNRDGLRLTNLNEGLGSYFGTTSGALVLEVDDDSDLQLRAGDVIVRIGDREITDAARAYRVLGSYAPDEPVRIEVMRQRQRVTVTGRP